MEPVKIILLCGGRLAVPTLKELAFSGLLGAVVIPSHCVDMLEEIKIGLAGSGIPIIEVTRQSFATEIIKAIELYQANLGLMVTFSFLLPVDVFKFPKHGFYNLHPGPLPNYRGPDPIFQQIKNQEKYAGVTLHFVDERFDTGPIFKTEFIRIEKTDTYGLLTTKIANLASRLVMVLVKLIGFETKIHLKQQDNSIGKYYKKQTAKDVTINWKTMDGNTIIALINACNPWNKGAVVKINNSLIKLLSASKLIDSNVINNNYLPGTIISINNSGIEVSTIKNESIKIELVSSDEGFLHAQQLLKLGFTRGQNFENI